VYIGLGPRITFKNVSISVPMRIERTFSSPDHFDLFILSAIFAYRITL
jgi:hypothetical protein